MLLLLLLAFLAGVWFVLRDAPAGFWLMSLCVGSSTLAVLLPIIALVLVVIAIATAMNGNAKTRIIRGVTQKALKNAGARLTANMDLADIGMLAYDGGSQPKVSRAEPIPAYITQLRPFLILDVAVVRAEPLTINFELLDPHGQVRFTDAQQINLKQGKNFLMPTHWLRKKDADTEGDWSLRVHLNEHMLALHHFTIAPQQGVGFRAYLHSDGEIDEWLSKSAASANIEGMSLDELIGEQSKQVNEARSH